MTRTLVVFESMFGNTQKVPEAVMEGLSIHPSTDILEVGTVPRPVRRAST